jgi:hypothetical protein
MVMKLPPEVSSFYCFNDTKLRITKRGKVAESTIVVAKNEVGFLLTIFSPQAKKGSTSEA